MNPKLAVKKKQVVDCLRQHHLFSMRPDEVMVEGSVAGISYRDVLELYLGLSGCRAFSWTDQDGGTSACRGFFPSLAALTQDLLQWCRLYWQQRRAIAALRHSKWPLNRARSLNSCAFLRTDHWFNVVSGGSVAHLSGVVSGLLSNGVVPNVISTDWLVNVPRELQSILRPINRVPGRNLPNFPELQYSEQVAEYVSTRWHEWCPDFIYQRYSLGNFAGPLLKRTFDVPFVCEYNGSFAWMAKHWSGQKLFHEKLLLEVEMLNLEAADVVVVVSEAMRAELIERDIPGSKIVVNPNGVDPDAYSPRCSGENVRRRFGLTDCHVIGFIGTFGPWHGAEVLSKAFIQLAAQSANVRLLMIGDGQTRGACERIVREAGVAEKVIFTGLVPQDQAPEFLGACDVLVAPHVPNPDGSPFFGSPTKLFEYMAMGKAIVASRLGQICEVLENQRTALLVPAGEKDAIAAAVKELLASASLRERIGGAARATCSERYTWKQHVAKILAFASDRAQRQDEVALSEIVLR